MTTQDEPLAPNRTGRATLLVGVGVAVAITVAALLWSKWVPYATRLAGLAATATYPGSSILGVGGVKPGDPPSWNAALSFTLTYADAVWKALVTALLISAALQVLVPQRWLARVLDRPGRWRAALAGGLMGTPTMMCTCCTAPVAATLRRSGVRTAAVVAYWWATRCSTPRCWPSCWS